MHTLHTHTLHTLHTHTHSVNIYIYIKNVWTHVYYVCMCLCVCVCVCVCEKEFKQDELNAPSISATVFFIWQRLCVCVWNRGLKTCLSAFNTDYQFYCARLLLWLCFHFSDGLLFSWPTFLAMRGTRVDRLLWPCVAPKLTVSSFGHMWHQSWPSLLAMCGTKVERRLWPCLAPLFMKPSWPVWHVDWSYLFPLSGTSADRPSVSLSCLSLSGTWSYRLCPPWHLSLPFVPAMPSAKKKRKKKQTQRKENKEQQQQTPGHLHTTHITLRAPLSGTLFQTLPELVTPLKGHSLFPPSCPPTMSAPSERFGYWQDCGSNIVLCWSRDTTLHYLL